MGRGANEAQRRGTRFAAPVARVLACVLGAQALAKSAAAHEQAGALGTAASATDYYRVSCYDDGNGVPASLSLQVRDGAPSDAQKVSVQVHFADALANATDANDGDALYGALVTLNGGSAVYDVLVDKNTAGSETYQFAYHCWTGPNATGLHTGTDIVVVQSQ